VVALEEGEEEEEEDEEEESFLANSIKLPNVMSPCGSGQQKKAMRLQGSFWRMAVPSTPFFSYG
jgi:hypothetical protein